MSAPRKLQVCGYCAGAPRSKSGAFLAHMACQSSTCACRATGHIVTAEIAAVQRKYTHGLAEPDLTPEGDA
jgi:hypothetical protein